MYQESMWIIRMNLLESEDLIYFGLELGDEENSDAGIAMMSNDDYPDNMPKHISITVVLDACGSDEELFNKQKEALKYFAKEIYSLFTKPNLTIIYTKPRNQCDYGKNYSNFTYEDFLEDLDRIEYVTVEQNYGMSEALYRAKRTGYYSIQEHVLFVVLGTDWSNAKPGEARIDYDIELTLLEQNQFEYKSGLARGSGKTCSRICLPKM